jgi:hypothetical protein
MKRTTTQEPLFISKERAMKILKPYVAILREVLSAAWADWEALPAKQRAKLNGRARASCLYDFMVDHVERRFGNNTNAFFFRRRGLFLLGLAGLVTLRFKKLGYGKKTSNIQTAQQVNIFGLQLELDGIPKAARLTVGYLLDPSQTFIKDVFVTLQMGNEVKWDFSLFEGQPALVFPRNKRLREAEVKVKAKPIKKQSDA